MNKENELMLDSVLKTLDVEDIHNAVIVYGSKSSGKCIVRCFADNAFMSVGLLVYGAYLMLDKINGGKNV